MTRITPTFISFIRAYFIGLCEALKKANGIIASVSKAIIPTNNFRRIGLFSKSKIGKNESKNTIKIVRKAATPISIEKKAVEIKASFFSTLL